MQWCKSSKSADDGADACLELAEHDGEILMRESDHPSVVIHTTRAKLCAFLDGAKESEFDNLARRKAR
ncbi:DUF397 domain-containing protein [Streptomyces niveus]|uniref:DUF397 domain-containing protein n=1 Tax=Streptomyces niveus TaxID=193462 RepID=UPI00342B837C